MSWVNVYLPDELAGRARASGLNVSALTQAAITAELERDAVDAWLDALPKPRGTVSHQTALAALNDARDEFGGDA